MGRKTGKNNDALAQKLIQKAFTLLGKALVSVGRPIYYLLSYLIFSILYIANITGYFTRSLLKLFFIIFPSKIYGISRTTLRSKKLRVKLLKISLVVVTSLKSISDFFMKAFLGVLTILAFLIFGLFELLKGAGVWLFTKLSSVKPKKRLKIVKLKTRLKLVHLNSARLSLKIPRAKLATPSKVKLLLFASTLFVFTGIFASYVFWLVVISDLPPAEELAERKQQVSTKIYDRNGEILYNIYEDQNRTPVPLDRIPAQVRLATIAIEDAEFYNHPGFSVRGIARALVKLIKGGEVTGGSTITQQLVKNALLTPEQTVTRKLREIVLAIRVELVFSKDQILEMYLNEVAYGGTAYGVQEAAQVFFDKNVDQLTLSEAALLAGLPKSPTTYSPYGQNPDFAFARQKEVLHLMEVNGFITSEQKMTAEEEVMKFSSNVINIKAPHFVMYVRQELAEKYGVVVVSKGGLTVSTTLDLDIQEMAEEVIKSEIDSLISQKVGNGAAVVLDIQSGEILAMVGSKDYFDLEADGNVNLTTSPRQPGSSIKVVNYSYALSLGYTPLTILEDTTKTFYVDGLPPYTPRNYDGAYRGKLTLRSALAESRNVPAVKVLESYGVDNMIEQGRKMGITTWTDPSNYGLSLTLGGGEVKLLDLANVYATIGNYGDRPKITSTLRVVNYEGEVLEEASCNSNERPSFIAKVAEEGIVSNSNDCEQEQVLDPRVAYMLVDILRDNNARAPAFGSNSLLVIPGHDDVAVKTGTSNDLRDNITIGFNQKYLVAVWVGNNDNSPMSRVASGITGATPIWHKIMSALLSRNETAYAQTNNDWPVPKGLVRLPICTVTNSLACDGCSNLSELFLEENSPTLACNPEYIKYIKEKEKVEPFGATQGG